MVIFGEFALYNDKLHEMVLYHYKPTAIVYTCTVYTVFMQIQPIPCGASPLASVHGNFHKRCLTSLFCCKCYGASLLNVIIVVTLFGVGFKVRSYNCYNVLL